MSRVIVTREQVSTALFTLLKSAYAFKYTSRRFILWDKLPDAQKPSLLLIEPHEHHAKKQLITPAVRTTDFEVYVYTSAGKDPNATPIILLNNIIDAIDPVSDGVLAPNFQGRQTLGGLVTNCYIDGDIHKVPGDLDGQGVAIFPVKVEFM